MKLIYIEWCDAITNPNWMDKDQAESWAEKSEWIIREAGGLIKELQKIMDTAEEVVNKLKEGKYEK